MKVVCSIDSFKGCLSSTEANAAAARAVQNYFSSKQDDKSNVIEIPISDGGEGMVEAFGSILNDLKQITLDAHGPLMEPLSATYLISSDGKNAYMEMASTCGLPLVPIELRNPELTTTYGFGEMLEDALKRGVKNIIIGIGGSATNDAGKGMMEVLTKVKGVSLNYGQQLQFNGNPINITVACDVQNPLFGPEGAAYVFAPQKGADEDMVKRLDSRLKDIYKASGCKDSVPGDGAAGGLGFALRYYLGATLKPGIDIVLDALNFENQIMDADLIITGEGKCDRQTLMGKVPFGILKRAQKYNVPVHLLSGKVEDLDTLIKAGFTGVHCINDLDKEKPLQEQMRPEVAKNNIYKTTLKLLMRDL